MVQLKSFCARWFLLAINVEATPSAFAQTVGDDDFSVTLDFRYSYGEADGSIQLPGGGTPGSTSPNRPSLDEIGIDDVHVFDGSLAIQFQPHILTFGGQLIQMDGSATLESDLISESVLFPAGSNVSSDVQLDWYRLGYQYEFRLDLNNSHELRLAPGIEGVFLDFHYQLDGPGAAHADRSYTIGGLRLGGSVEWLIDDGPFSIEASAWWGVPLNTTAEILTLQLTGKWQLWGESPDTGGMIYAGVAFETIEYEDDQTVPNRIDIELGPLVTFGLQIRF